MSDRLPWLLVLAALFLLVTAGIYVLSGGKFSLPGDIHIRTGRVSIHFPLGTSILVSVVLTLLLNLILLIVRRK